MSSILSRYANNPGVGDTKMSNRDVDHDGWLVCDGRLMDKTIYTRLFRILGYTYGGNDAIGFKLPDMRGRVIGAAGAGQVTDQAGRTLTDRPKGTYTGEEVHLLTTAEMPSHNHGVTDPGHTHSFVKNTNDQSVISTLANENAADDEDLAGTTGTSTTGITINNTGGGLVHNVMQPTLFAGNMFVFSGIYK